jgi:hypothetical protein
MTKSPLLNSLWKEIKFQSIINLILASKTPKNKKWRFKTMKDFISKLQKDLKGLQDAIKKDSDQLVQTVKTYATKENLRSAGVEIEKLVEHRFKKMEPTINKVLGEIKKNAAKAGINVDDVESKVRSTVKKAASQFKDAADRRGITTVAKKAAEKAKGVATKAKASGKKATKAKAPSTKAATRSKKPSAATKNVAEKKLETTQD